MPFVDTIEQGILNGVIQDPAFAGFANLFVALSSTTPNDAGTNVTEPSGGAYARVSTAAANWAAATGTAPATKSNSTVITFPTATADWLAGVDLTHFVLYDALTVGNPIAWGALGTPKPILEDDTASFPIGSLVLRLGKPADFP